MKTKATAGALMVLCLLFVTVSVVDVTEAKLDVLVVPDDYPTIGAAVESATDGDIVLVKGGVYYEHLEINKSIWLAGQNKETVVIDGNKTGPVILVNHNDVNITNLTVQNGMDVTTSGLFSSHSGIHLLHVSGCGVSQNIIKNNSYGIWLYESSENTIFGNDISTSNIGININSSSNSNMILHNRIEGSTLYIHHPPYEDESAYGLLMSKSSANTVSENAIAKNKEGIGLYLSSNNRIIQNIIQNNEVCGVTTVNSYSENNTFYNNVFSNDNQVSTSTGVINNWDNGETGNYWSDYTGTDTDGDGIGDTPYIINDGNRDNYPYMTPEQIPEFQPELITILVLVASLTIVLFKKKVWRQAT